MERRHQDEKSRESSQLHSTIEHSPNMGHGSVNESVRRLASGRCVPCNDAKPFTVDEAEERLKDLPGWALQSGSIQKEFRFKSYLAGLDFAYSLGKAAELENHHPDLFIGWRRVKVEWSTHAIKGLSQNDFIMAARSELEYLRQKGQDIR
jgi:4a-hydroxytetrahydrobiopterin dehydratase